MDSLGITDKDYIKIKTLCEFLFFDQYKETASFLRFEKCFQPLFNNIDNISMINIFKDIAGLKRKYITFKRFLKAYSLYKNNKEKLTEDTKIFFSRIINSILKEENDFVGNNNGMIFSTTTTSKIKNSITFLQVLIDKQGKIHGINLIYDNVSKINMLPKIIENELEIGLEINLEILDKKTFNINLKKYKNINDELYRDSITHIFGTINNKGFISFLGFKCLSGKTLYVGFPDGEGFLFGKFGYKIHDFRICLNKEGITKIQPGLRKNLRPNYYLKEINKYNEKDLNEDEIIKDEKNLINIDNEKEIDKLITIPLLDDNQFFNENWEDDYCGNDYKEVINQYPRKWLEDKFINKSELINSIDDVMDFYNNEKTKSIIKSTIIMNQKANEEYKYNSFDNPFLLVNNFNISKKIPNPFFFIEPNKNIFEPLNIDTGKILHKTKFYKSHFSTIVKKEEKKHVYKKINQTVIIFRNKNLNINNFFNKKNYNQILETLTNDIRKELEKDYFDNNNMIHKIFLNKLFPYHENNYQEIFSDDNNKMLDKDFAKLKEKNENENEEYSNSLCSPALSFEEKLMKIKGKSHFFSFNLFKNFFNKDSDNKKCISKWKNLANNLGKRTGKFLFQSIVAVIKAMNSLNQKNISLSEKIRLQEILKSNRNIINYLNNKNIIQKEEEKEEEEEEPEILIPDEHPEKITSLTVLQLNLDKLKELKLQNLSKEQKEKVELLYNLYLKQKNILIENETNRHKSQLIRKNCIDIGKYLKEEEEERNKLIRIENEKIAEAEHKKKLKEKEESKNLLKGSFFDYELKTKNIFLKQSLPKKFESWKDNQFIPCKNTICPHDGKDWILTDVDEQDFDKNWDNLDWFHPDQITNFNNYNIFKAEPKIENVIQGNLNDCYFQSAVAALCAYKSFYDKIFHIKYRTKENTYGVYLYLNGKWKLVLIDDYLPLFVVNNQKSLYFGYSIEEEIWVSLLEKAWAKVNGSYIKIGSGGLCKESFDVLTEAYTEQIFIKYEDPHKIWEKIENAIKHKYLMCLGTPPEIDFMDVGLIDGHAYSLIKAYIVKTNKGSEKILKLRNPYGKIEYSGRWSDASDVWTDELRKICEFPGIKEDGIFYMSFDDMRRYFFSLEIAKIEPNYTTKSIKIKKEENIKCQVIEFENKEKNNCFINIYQKNPRIIKRDGKHYNNPVLCFIILVKKEGDNLKYIDSASSILKLKKGSYNYKIHSSLQKNLEKGTYYILSDVNYRYIYNNNSGYTITTYSENPIKELNNITNKVNTEEIFKKTIINYFSNKKKENSTTNLDIYKENMTIDLPFHKFCFYNKSELDIKIELNINNIEENECCCFYCDKSAEEGDVSIIKNIKPKSFGTCIILPYRISSKFKCTFTIL